MQPTVFAIEGIDRLGKSTLIEGLLNRLGYYQVIHFSKPLKLNAYAHASDRSLSFAGVPLHSQQLYQYQSQSFRNSMLLAKSGARIIFDRWHLGEAVYAPMYRAYRGDYVFDFERRHELDAVSGLRLILLTEDFQVSRHFVDDGESLGAVEKREEEQALFLSAFERSIIRDKRVICVTDPALGGFKPKDWILDEVLA